MLKESNVRKGFFEHGDFLALREALPEYPEEHGYIRLQNGLATV